MKFCPEILNDELYHTIIDLVKLFKPSTILEIGSANGLGSTQAFIRGMEEMGKPFGACTLICTEIDKDRADELRENVGGLDVHVLVMQGSTVEKKDYMKEKDVVKLLDKNPELKTNQYSKDLILSWLEDNLRSVEWDRSTLDIILKKNTIDLVLIDGSAFTGYAEFKKVDGAKVIVLDDTQDVKCWEAYQELLKRDDYELYKENKELRNGFAIFIKKEKN